MVYPAVLKRYDQWIVWKLETRNNDPKPTKVPYNPKNVYQRASSTDPTTWATFDAAEIILHSGMGFSGIGFVFTKDDPFIAIDIDHCFDVDKKLNKCAFVNTSLFDTYTEVSQSGNGLHIIGIGKNPGGSDTGHKKGDLEFYTHGRFFALTGNVYGKYDTVKIIPQCMLSEFYTKYFKEPDRKKLPAPSKPKTSQGLNLSDEKIIELCSHAKNSGKFNALWNGSFTEYPSPSEADMALCMILAFYTKDKSQLKRLLLHSGLYREKSDRADYLELTIGKATSLVNEQYSLKCWKCGQDINEDDSYCSRCRTSLKNRK